VKMASPAQNEELMAKFEERNLEAGIPTPSFLFNARKNLKKPGSEKTVVNGNSSDPDAISKVAVKDAASAVGATAATAALDGNDPSQKKSVSGDVNVCNHGTNNIGKTHSYSSDSESIKTGERLQPPGHVKSNLDAKKVGKAHPSPRYATSSSFTNIIYGSDLDSNKKASPSPGCAMSNSMNSAGGGSQIGTGGSLDETSAKVKKNNTSRANSDSKQSHEKLAARRSRMVTSRGVSSTSASSVLSVNPKQSSSKVATSTGTTTSAKKPMRASHGNNRREKMVARVRAAQISTTSENKSNPKQHPRNSGNCDATSASDSNSVVSFDASKNKVISPKNDEFEVLFACDAFHPTPNPTESIDSIANEMHMLHDAMLMRSISAGDSTVATLPTNNIQPRVKVTVSTDDEKNRLKPIGSSTVTPEKARLHNASTPKIRGNGTQKRDQSYNGEAAGGGNDTASTGGNNKNGSHRGSPQKHSSRGKSLQSCQENEQQVLASPLEEYLPLDSQNHSTPRRHHSQLSSHNNDVSQSYPLRQSPSQMSQMSGITTPSCFPQEYNFPMTSTPVGHLQQPMLVGGPIPECTSSTSSRNMNGQVRTGLGSGSGLIGSGSAFTSPGMESENLRLREQLGSLKKKLEEKDAIISQLMKRIGDLENRNTTVGMSVAQAHQVNTSLEPQNMGVITAPSTVSTSLHSVGARSTGASDPTHLSSLWEHSQPAVSGSASTSSFHRHAFQTTSTSVDTESLGVSALSSPVHAEHSHPQSQQSNIAQQTQHQRGGSNATSSTSSMTSANSSKSGARRQISRTKSLSDSSRKSSRRQRKKKEADDRKFVC